MLIVDDTAMNLRVAEELLSPYGMRIDSCKSGRQALTMIAANRYDLVLMDHIMPEMDGLETTARIRALDGGHYKSLPVIALTASVIPNAPGMFIESGMNGFIAKPVDMAALDTELAKWIPADKRRAASSANRDEAAESFVSGLRRIRALSVDKAEALVGGADAYARIVRLTTRLLPENMDRMNAVVGTGAYYTEVHGVKGALNSIGAYKLGEMAHMLESFAKKGDYSSCRALHPGFDKALGALWKKLNALAEQGGEAKPSSEPERVLRALPEIESAIRCFDSLQALKLLSPLSAYSYGKETDALVTGLTAALERFDFDAAAGLLLRLREI